MANTIRAFFAISLACAACVEPTSSPGDVGTTLDGDAIADANFQDTFTRDLGAIDSGSMEDAAADVPRRDSDTTDVRALDASTGDASATDAGAVDAPADVAGDAPSTDAPEAGCPSPLAHCGPFPSSGVEGAFAPTANVVLPSGAHHFTTVMVPAGVTVSTDGDGVLELLATGDVTVFGTIDVSGGDAPVPESCPAPSLTATSYQCDGGRGGTTGHRGVGPVGAGGGFQRFGIDMMTWGHSIFSQGGAGVAGGGGGSSSRSCGGYALIPAGGSSGGGGAAGGECSMDVTPGHWTCVSARGGASVVAGYAGHDAPALVVTSCGPGFGDGWSAGGGGGGSIGNPAAMDLAVTSTFHVGSAGGGGGNGQPRGIGGGGGGGGGALRIASPSRITLAPGARLLANGGAGSPGAGGGGGSGGVIYLAAPAIEVPIDAQVSATAGLGSAPGGDGGPGRVRLSVRAETCQLAGRFDPPLVAGCAPTPGGTALRTYVGLYPE